MSEVVDELSVDAALILAVLSDTDLSALYSKCMVMRLGIQYLPLCVDQQLID